LLQPAAARPEAEKSGRALSLEAELRAARSHQLYLVIDPRGPQVDLKASGMLLRSFPAERALFASPRLGRAEDRWPAAGFRLVSELPEPERPKIRIPDQGKTKAKVGGPVTEANIQGVPTHYRLRFAPALDVSVLGEAGLPELPGRLFRLRHRLLEGWGALFGRLAGDPLPPRVVLIMKPEDARRLFVALKPDIDLVMRF
jgi:hypothetical protein